MAKQPRSVVTQVRLTERDAAAIRKAADRAGVTFSEYIRGATLSYMAMSLNPHALRMLVDGLSTLTDELLKGGRSEVSRT